MRIVGGKWRGRQVASPEGRGTTRPTTDRTREAVASMILAACGLDLTGRPVLDAFAGSGAMGLELVSRGAPRVTLVDADRRAVGRIRATARSLGAEKDEVTALAGDVFALAARGRLPGAPFGVVFLDPPYATDAARVSGLVEQLACSGQLAEGAVVVYERAAEAAPLSCACLGPARTRTRGITAVDLAVYGKERGREEGGDEHDGH